MEWNDKELVEIRLIVEHMSVSLNIAFGITLLLDINQEKVLYCRNGKTFKSISISGDNARVVFWDTIVNLDLDNL